MASRWPLRSHATKGTGMGRTTKPTHLRIVEGTRDRRKGKGKGEPVPPNPLGPAPRGMTEREVEVWHRVGRELPPGMLRSVDEYMVTAFCRAVAIADEAADLLRNPAKWERELTDEEKAAGVTRSSPPPLLAETPNGFLQQSAYLSIINKQAVIIKALGTELGLSPAARTRISVSDGDEDDDPNAKYF